MPILTDTKVLKDMATRIRIHSIDSTSAANSGHPTTSSSCAEILAVLFFNTMRYKVSEPKDPSSDRLVLSKGHAAPALYGAWVENGLIPREELKRSRQIDCDLEGHPTPRLSFVDVGTGSLGQGLSVASGMAYVGKYVDKSDYRTYCLTGDGEFAEGAIWEAATFAGFHKLDNLVLVIDVNRLGQSEETMIGHNLEIYKKRLDVFDFESFIVDGHNVEELVNAFDTAASVKGKPTAIIAKTFKGKDFPCIENKDNWHGKPLGGESERVLTHLRTLLSITCSEFNFTIPPPTCTVPTVDISKMSLSSPPDYQKGYLLATRSAYGTALVKLIHTTPRIICFDGDMKNSTFSLDVKKYNSENFVECYIAEQNMVGVAVGAACRGRTVAFVSTFGAFLTRAFDQIRMAAISQSNINICGSHAGVSIGEDGASQMALEDLAMFRTIPYCTVFYPADVVATERAIELAANTTGITYIRTSRPPAPVIYANDQEFSIGKAIVVQSSANDQALVIGGGITLHEAIAAASQLAEEGVGVRIMDLFTIKPIDKEGIIKNAKDVGGRIIVVEDHYPEGGIGEAVLSAVAQERDICVKHAAIPKLPHSGKCADLLEHYGINTKHIIQYVRELIQK